MKSDETLGNNVAEVLCRNNNLIKILVAKARGKEKIQYLEDFKDDKENYYGNSWRGSFGGV